MYDLIVLGGGPAGLTAGIYAARGKLKTLIIEKAMEGGQISSTSEVENYPGILETSGVELGMDMKEQAENFGAEFIYEEVSEVQLEGDVKRVVGKNGTYEASTIIIATGASPRKMLCQGEEQFAGKGVSYCATCDAAFYQDLDVYIVGGGDAAVEEALFVAKFAKKVYIIHRRDELRASKILQRKAMENEKIDFIFDSVVEEIKGDKTVKGLVIRNIKTGEVQNVNGDKPIGIFVYVGYDPNTGLFEGQVEMDRGYIITDSEMRTNIPGVFAAGDLRVKSVRQVITAAADGAIAAVNAQKYVDEKAGNLYEGFVEQNK
ncbi:MAG: thioredoxin-disulfide reductase [Peptoniphilus sp.]|nr:thioredoxin-disulfide reductase [Peptoniphilus sp.]